MTDKEWYAKLSTIVLEGIDQINKGKDTWQNQYKIERFVKDETTPEKEKAEMRRKVFLNISEAMKWVGYIGGLLLLMIDGMAWLICVCEGVGFGVPAVMMIMAAGLGAMGLTGKIWYDLL